MTYVLIEHKVAKWAEFESVFRDDGERRRMLGCKGGRVFRNVDDPDGVFVVLEWNSLEGAKKFVEGMETHEAMEWATAGTRSRVHVVDELFEVDA
jgi:heme-degrading monooxygenase HmoA